MMSNRGTARLTQNPVKEMRFIPLDCCIIGPLRPIFNCLGKMEKHRFGAQYSVYPE